MRKGLQARLLGECEIEFRRDFAAPRLRLWTALTDPALVRRWLWADHIPMTTCEMDLRVGGRYRWVWTRPDGSEMGMGGQFLQIEAPQTLVTTELFDEDWTEGETLVTQTLTELAPDRTQLRLVIRYASSAARDRAFASPMGEGMEQAYDRLDAQLIGA